MGRNKLFTIRGRSLTLREWSAESGIPYATLQSRLYHARWPVDRLLEPIQRVSWRSLELGDGTRVCRKCERRLPVADFVEVAASQTAARRYTCKTCERERIAAWRRDDPKRGKRPRERFRAYRKDAEARGLTFSFGYEDFLKYWGKPCTYCGDEIEGIGLDRQDSALGYVPENVVPCCWECNRMKNDCALPAFLARVRRIADRHA